MITIIKIISFMNSLGKIERSYLITITTSMIIIS
jgi:hypothetical protein